VKSVPFDETNRGDPFLGDFPEWLDQGQRSELQARVQPQITELAQRRHAPSDRQRLLGLLRQRREPRLGGQEPPQPEQRAVGHGAVTAFDFLPVDVGFDTLHARSELLITSQSYDGRHAPIGGRSQDTYAKGYLDSLGIVASETECRELRGRVLRLTRPDADLEPWELAVVARSLRNRGFVASLNHMMPTGYVGKAIGGPLPAPSPGPYQPDGGPGEPTKVAIIDTGIAAEIRADGWLDRVPRADNVDPLDRFPLPAGDGYLDFDAGHGTFVAGIVQQVSPGAEITVYRALDSDGLASEVTVACEMIRAVKEGGAQIVNLSLGGHTLDNVPPVALQAALEIITEWEHETGREVLIVAAAGNYADATPCWPAAFRRVVSVASLAPDMLPSQWSSHGFWVTCSTIGQGLRSTFVEGLESDLVNPEPHDFGPDSWAAWSGTSFTAPQITGALALLHERYGYPLREALGRLLAAGQATPDCGQALRILPAI
jgi:hypothetical protein